MQQISMLLIVFGRSGPIVNASDILGSHRHVMVAVEITDLRQIRSALSESAYDCVIPSADDIVSLPRHDMNGIQPQIKNIPQKHEFPHLLIPGDHLEQSADITGVGGSEPTVIRIVTYMDITYNHNLCSFHDMSFSSFPSVPASRRVKG